MPPDMLGGRSAAIAGEQRLTPLSPGSAQTFVRIRPVAMPGGPQRRSASTRLDVAAVHAPRSSRCA